MGLSAGTGKLCFFGHLGLVFIWSCFVFCLLLLLYYVICAPVLTERTQKMWCTCKVVVLVIKTESTRWFSNFDFQGTKILYQNNLKYIPFRFLHFSRTKDVINHLYWTPKKFLLGARENECQILQNYILHMKFLEFYLHNHKSCEIWLLFSRTSRINFLWFVLQMRVKKRRFKTSYVAVLIKALFEFNRFLSFKTS